MEEINVAFSDSTEQAIVSYFASPQDPELHQNLGVVAASDERWKTFYESLPALTNASLPVPDSATPPA